MHFVCIASCIIFTLIPIIHGENDCSESRKMCEIRTAITSGIASVVDALPQYNFDTKMQLVILGYYHDPKVNFCAMSCSTEITIEDFDKADKLLMNFDLNMADLIDKQKAHYTKMDFSTSN